MHVFAQHRVTRALALWSVFEGATGSTPTRAKVSGATRVSGSPG